MLFSSLAQAAATPPNSDISTWGVLGLTVPPSRPGSSKVQRILAVRAMAWLSIVKVGWLLAAKCEERMQVFVVSAPATMTIVLTSMPFGVLRGLKET